MSARSIRCGRSLVEMGRAVVRDGHRNGGVVLLMWAGILAYLDRYGYDYVTGCVSVPIGGESRRRAASCAASATSSSAGTVHRRSTRVYPHRPVVVDGTAIDDIPPPATAVGAAADARISAAGRAGVRRTRA